MTKDAKGTQATTSNVLDLLDQLYVFLSEIQPLRYLAWYLSLIVVFAGIYWSLPGQNFYENNVEQEPAAGTDKGLVGTNIARSLARSWEAHKQEGQGWTVRPDSFKIDKMVGNEIDGLTFRVGFTAERKVNGEVRAVISGASSKFVTAREFIGVWPNGTEVNCHIVELSGKSWGLEFSPEITLMLRSPDPAIGADVICWSPQEEGRFDRLVRGLDGDPRALSGYFGRMLYLSATTITTTGFGDIVPLTGLARFCTGLEAVLGWILAGLFLNAAATRAASKSTRSYDAI